MASPFLSIVIPSFNEESRISATLEQVLDYLGRQPYRWEVIVVDDGSTDSTAAQVQRVARERGGDHTISLLSLAHRGKGWAVKQGMLHAKGQYRFMCDADLSMPIEQVARFLPPQRCDYDIAIGSREIPGSRRIGEPRRRRVMARSFGLLVQALAMAKFADTQCGFKCFQAEAANQLFAQQRLHGFAFDVELLFLALKQGLRIVEVPIDWYYRSHSKVKPLKDSAVVIRDLLRIRWHYLRGRYIIDGETPQPPE